MNDEEGERAIERQTPPPPPPRPMSRKPDAGSISGPRDSGLSGRQTLNLRSHAGAPRCFF